MKTKEKKNSKTKPKAKNESLFYLSEDAKNWDFSDYVRVTSNPRGMKLSFGKFISEDNRFGIFKEITIPFDVAESLMQIIQKQLEDLLKQGLLQKVKPQKDE